MKASRASVLRRVFLATGVVLATLYVCDDLSVRYRMAHGRPSDPLEDVTVYYATTLKNGKLEVYYDQPQTQTCVHAMFPHFGYSPCWSARQRRVRVISQGG
jgi:hypothetical protein